MNVCSECKYAINLDDLDYPKSTRVYCELFEEYFDIGEQACNPNEIELQELYKNKKT